MPIYEYRCSSCSFQKEYLQKVSDPLLSLCPECGKQTFGKMLTAAGFQLKGGGWYATDFKNSGAKPAAKSENQGAPAGKTEATSEATSKGASKGEDTVKGNGKDKGKGGSDSQSPSAPAAAPAPAPSPAKAE